MNGNRNNENGGMSGTLDVSRFPVARRWYHRALFSCLKSVCRRRLDLRAEGLENIETGKRYLYCPNHQTFFDGFFVWAALGDKCPKLDNIGGMAKAEHLDHRLTTFLMKMMGSIPVDRTGDTGGAIQRSIDFIKEGHNFMIHPEGTRTKTGELGPFKKGAAHIALAAGVPVAISGGFEIWPYNRKRPQTRDENGRKQVLTVAFCPEVQTLGRSAEEITQEVRDKIERRLGERN